MSLSDSTINSSGISCASEKWASAAAQPILAGASAGMSAVGGTGENPCRCGVLLDRAEPPTDVAEFVLTHGDKITGGAAVAVAPNPVTWG